MKLLEKIKNFFSDGNGAHWGQMIENMKNSQMAHHQYVSSQMKMNHDRTENLANQYDSLCLACDEISLKYEKQEKLYEDLIADYKQTLDLLFKQGQTLADLRKESLSLKQKVKKLNPKTKKRLIEEK